MKLQYRKKKEYIPFHKQFQKCHEENNLFYIDCYICGQKIIICKKYNDICHSKACFSQRYKHE